MFLVWENQVMFNFRWDWNHKVHLQDINFHRHLVSESLQEKSCCQVIHYYLIEMSVRENCIGCFLQGTLAKHWQKFVSIILVSLFVFIDRCWQTYVNFYVHLKWKPVVFALSKLSIVYLLQISGLKCLFVLEDWSGMISKVCESLAEVSLQWMTGSAC